MWRHLYVGQLAAFLLLLSAHLLPVGQAGGQEAASVHPWDVYELEMTSERELSNPYVEGLPESDAGYVVVTFQGESGEAEGQQLKITGFWDGGRTWRARFAPPASGEWSYRSSSADPGLGSATGRFRCAAWTDAQRQANATRRGFVQVRQSGAGAGRCFEYADGTPMLWLGDTWWNWTKRSIPIGRFQRLVDDRAEKGFNVGQLFFAARGWGRESSLLDETFTQPDLQHIRHVEQMIQYANQNGITVWVHGWWVRPDMKDSIGEEHIRRWCRYMTHRLGAYNVIWVLAGEYNMHDYGGLGLDFWKDLGRLFEAEDPYDRIIGAHPTPPGWDGGADAPQWSTAEVMHREDWLDYNQSQTGHGRWRNELIPDIVQTSYQRKPAKPIVVTEPWYEFVEGNPTAADIRFGGWSAVLSGAAGHSYGGGHVWQAHVPEAPAGRGAWPLELEFERDTLDYPGARSLSFMAQLLRGIDWWTLEPHPELVLDNPSRYCGAVPGRHYVVFLRWGGVVRLNLRSSSPQQQFEYRWIDLVDEQVKRSGEVNGGEIRQFPPPADYPGVEQYRDWILHVVAK
ncbi:MAG: apiosidase-like domain-containing protein [Pirellulaceae bacterium]